MSQEHVEVARRSLEEYGPGPPEAGAGSVAEYWEADGDYYPARKFPGARPCHGQEEIARFHRTYLDAWGRFEFGIKDLIQVADDRVLAHVSLHGTGHGSGMPLEGDVFQCYWLRHGRFFRVEDHLTLKGALHALGLEGDSVKARGLRE
jgi:hypothetical protein